MAYVAGVLAYGSDGDTSESDVIALDVPAPQLVPVVGLGMDTTRQWATGLKVSPRGASAPSCQLDGAEIPTVDNFIAGPNISIVKTGRDVLIGSSGGGGGGKGIAGAYDIEAGGSPTYIDAGLSDEFDSGTLNSSWTVAQGTSGTVDLLGTVASSTYDLTTRSKGMLVQTPNGINSEFRLRAPVIASGEEIIVSMAFSDTGIQSNNAYNAGMSVSSGSASELDGNFAALYLDGSDNGTIALFGGTTPLTFLTPDVGRFGGRIYWRIVRNPSGFFFFFSLDGIAWVPTGMLNPSSAAYVWVFCGARASYTRGAGPDPITCINWIRHCAYTGLDPW